jgi:hypothetical protein
MSAEEEKANAPVPICSACRRVRDEAGQWSLLQEFMISHFAARLSHSICPDCARRLYPEYFGEMYPELRDPPAVPPIGQP